jgi:hypothetical protein
VRCATSLKAEQTHQKQKTVLLTINSPSLTNRFREEKQESKKTTAVFIPTLKKQEGHPAILSVRFLMAGISVAHFSVIATPAGNAERLHHVRARFRMQRTWHLDQVDDSQRVSGI